MNENGWGPPRHVLRWAFVTFGILALVLVAFSALFFVTRAWWGGYGPFYHPFFFPFGWIFGIFWIFVIFGALRCFFWPWRWGYGRRYWRYHDESYYVLRERYAKGEITKDEFENMTQTLQKHSGT